MFGVLAAWAKGPNGGVDAVARLRTDVGNLSTPWLLVGFVAGTQTSRLRSGALLGLLATMLALFGFYLYSSLVVDLGGHGLLGDLRRELFANRVYLEAGVVSGPIFGALGAWWTGRRSLRASFLVGALLIGEPLLLAAIGLVGSATSIAVYGAEFALGLAVLTWAVWRARSSRQTSLVRGSA